MSSYLVDIAVHANEMVDIDYFGRDDQGITYKHFDKWTSDTEQYLVSLSHDVA